MAQKCPSCGHKAYLGLMAVECENPVCLHFKMPPTVKEADYTGYARISHPLVLSVRRWLSLHVAGPVSAQNEVDYAGYSRIEFDQGHTMTSHTVFAGAHWYTRIMNHIELSFPTCTGRGNWASHFGYWDHNGLLHSGRLGSTISIFTGVQPVFQSHSIIIDVP